MLKIGILLGDDIGREVVPECVKVIKAAAGKVIPEPPVRAQRRGYRVRTGGE